MSIPKHATSANSQLSLFADETVDSVVQDVIAPQKDKQPRKPQKSLIAQYVDFYLDAYGDNVFFEYPWLLEDLLVDTEEIWKRIEGTDDYYIGFFKGLVLSFSQGTAYLLRPIGETYPKVTLHVNSKSKRCTLHTSAAKAFLPNPENKPQVNHKNGLKHDSSAMNLEWCTQSENLLHAVQTGLINYRFRNPPPRRSDESDYYKAVIQKTPKGEFIRKWPSASYAARHLGLIDFYGISECARGESKLAYGFIWQYVDMPTFYEELQKVESLPNEVWLPLPEHQDRYMISNFGRVKVVERVIVNTRSQQKFHTEQLRKNTLVGTGILRIFIKGEKQVSYNVARLVAELFVPNPHNYFYYRFKDKDKTNVKASNIEWVKCSNESYASNIGKRTKTLYQYDIEGKLIKTWPSLMAATSECRSAATLSRAANRNLVAYNYKWSYEPLE